MRLDGWLGEAEPGDIVSVYSIDINLFTELQNSNALVDEINMDEIKIGQARCYFLSGYDWVQESFVDLRDIADSISGDLLVAVKPVTDETGMLMDCYIHCNILYISKFFIEPEYRGKGIGRLVFPLIIDILCREVGVITIIPRPSEDNGQERIESNDPRYSSILKGMTKFIKKYGFCRGESEEEVWIKDTSLKD